MYSSIEIAERIKTLTKAHNVSVRKMLTDLGMAVNTMNNMKTSMPNSETLAKIADYLGCSVDYLLGRAGTADAKVPFLNQQTPWANNENLVPIISKIIPGTNLLNKENIEGFAPIRGKDISNYFFLKVSGNRMANANIYKEDLVLIKKQKVAEDGQIIAADFSEFGLSLWKFKKFNNDIFLLSESQNCEIYKITNTGNISSIQIYGIAIELRRLI